MKAIMDLARGGRRPPVESIAFESLNAILPNEKLKKEEAEIIKGMNNVWYEYVPESYDGTQEVPLVVQIHGGGNDGLRWANITIWHEMAERNNFIVIYPNSPAPGTWNCEESDIEYVYDLIQLISKKYKINKDRIYMQGMSNGDMMTLAFTLAHPEVVAAAGYMTGPSIEEAINGDRPKGCLPILQMRGELDVNFMLSRDAEDVYEKRYHMNDINRELWEDVNETKDVLPYLSIEGKDNYLYWPGKKAPIINWEIKDMGHREPVHGSQVLWDRLYSGAAQKDGAHGFENPVKPIEGDEDTYIIALGSTKAYHKNEIIPMTNLTQGVVRMMVPAKSGHFAPLKLNEMAQTEAMYAPVEILSALFGAKIETEEAGRIVNIELADGRKVILRKDALLVEVDGTFTALQKPCILYFGCFYIPVEEFMRLIMNKQVSIAHDTMCISDHYALLGKYTARIVSKLLDGVMRPKEHVEWED